MRRRVFDSIEGDGALSKYVAVPSGEPKVLGELLIETLVRACDHRGRALAALELADKKPQEAQESKKG